MSEALQTRTDKNPMLWGEAFAAIGRLRKDPDDTKEVFVIIRALTGNSFVRSFKRFKNTEQGKYVLREKRSMLDFLQDRTPLKALPEGTLGHTYDAFMTHEGLSADGLAQASIDGEELSSNKRAERNEEMEIYGNWGRDIHDLFHVTSGYGRDELGELCLLAFTYAQTRNPGIGFIVLIGMLLAKRGRTGLPIIRCVLEGYRNGRRANWMVAEDWERLLELPLDEVRRKLNIRWPATYHKTIKMAREMSYDPRNGRVERGKEIQAIVEKNKIMDEAFVPIAPQYAVHG